MMMYNLGLRILIDHDGAVCEITNMYDADGDQTDNSDQVVAFVAKRSSHEWLTVTADGEDALAG
jgi:hypothetical protein